MTTQARRATRRIIGPLVLATGSAVLAVGPAIAAPTPVPVGAPPVAVITLPSTVYAGIPVTLSGAGSSTPTGGISEWEWDLDGSSGYERASTGISWVTESFERGRRTVKLRVRNTGGLVATATKSFTVVRPPLVDSEPGSPTALEARADGTSLDVTWDEPADPLAGEPVAYRVTAESESEPVFVPADQPLEVTFDGMVPGEYTVRVAAVNRLGTGPVASTAVEVPVKGATATPRPTGSTAPPPSVAAGPSTAAAVAAAASTTGQDRRDLVGYGLIGAGVVLLVGAVLTGAVATWRRRRADA